MIDLLTSLIVVISGIFRTLQYSFITNDATIVTMCDREDVKQDCTPKNIYTYGNHLLGSASIERELHTNRLKIYSADFFRPRHAPKKTTTATARKRSDYSFAVSFEKCIRTFFRC